MSSLTNAIEQQELITKLKDHGHEELVKMLLENEQQCYTKRGRLNKSGACRVLGWKTKDLEDALEQCRQILEKDMGE
jgi:hypothetical protein